jgi:hypothetical protein
MPQALQGRAEILKLARLLHVEPAELEYLVAVPVEDLVALREAVTETLFRAHGGVLTRLAAASRMLPTSVVAAIGERAFGPMLSARIAGLLDPERAVDMAGRMPISFLADIAVEIDPRRASAVIGRIPPEQVGAITRELVARGEFVTMGRFVGHLSPKSIAAAVAAMDDASLLRVAFVLESKDTVSEVVDLLGPGRTAGVIAAAVREDLWVEVLDLVSHLELRQIQPFLDIPQVSEVAALARIVAVAREEELWPQLLPLVEHLPEAAVGSLGQIVGGLGLGPDELRALRDAGNDPAVRPGLARLAAAAGLSAQLGLEDATAA